MKNLLYIPNLDHETLAMVVAALLDELNLYAYETNETLQGRKNGLLEIILEKEPLA